MAVTVVVQDVLPVAPPPKAYDILGLSQEQAEKLVSLLYCVFGPGEDNTNEVYSALAEALPSDAVRYHAVKHDDGFSLGMSCLRIVKENK